MGSTTPPWRVLEEPADPTPAAGGGRPDSPSPGPMFTLSATAIRTVALATGALVAGLAALAIASSSGSGGEIVVAGASGLPGSSDASAVAVVAASGAATGSTALVVEVVGAVAHPGVYHLGAGARIGDLIAAAGGYGARVDTARAGRSLNLAQPLHDGDQVRVPARDDPTEASAAPASVGTVGGAAAGAPSGPIDLNTATAEQLDTLPGIGPVTAAKILAARDEAPFATVDDLRSRGLVGEKTFEKLRDAVTVH